MNRWRGVLAVCAALGWWGAVYPQFTMVKGTYEIVYEDGSAQTECDAAEAEDGRDVYWEILEADRGQIRFKSRLLTEIKALQEQLRRGE